MYPLKRLVIPALLYLLSTSSYTSAQSVPELAKKKLVAA